MNNTETRKSFAEKARRDDVRARLNFAAAVETDKLFRELVTTPEGLSEILVPDVREVYGDNRVTRGKKVSLLQRIVVTVIT